MALVLDDRVKETSTTTGTGTLNLSGAVSGFQTFVAGIGDGNTTYYAIVNRDEDEWEVGLGTVTDASTDTLSRSAISSSNSDSAVDFSAGTKDVFCTLPASKIASLDTNNNLMIGSGSAGVDYTLTFDGADSDGVLTWMEDEDHFKFSDDVVMDSTKKLYFYDKGGEYISSNGSDLSIVAGDDIHLDATGNTWKFLTNTTLHFYIESNSGEMSFVNESQDLDQLFKGNDGGNAITALKLDMSEAGAATFNDKVIATELDISGNMDIDGTSNLDAVDIDGAVQIDATFTSGVDGQGYDVKFFGDTASPYMVWDTSADDLILAGGAGFVIPDAGNIGSASDTDAIAISSAGVVALSATTAASATTTAALTVAGGLGVAGDIWVGDDLTLDSDSAVLSFGDDQDITMTHVADTGVTIGGSHANGTNFQITNSAGDGDSVVQFALGGTVQYSMGVEDGDSDKFVINYGTGALGAQPALEISSAGAVTVPGNLTVSGTLAGAASAGFAVAMAIAL